jgi:hypothetical protein
MLAVLGYTVGTYMALFCAQILQVLANNKGFAQYLAQNPIYF